MLENIAVICLLSALVLSLLSSTAPLCCYKKFTSVKLIHTVFLGLSAACALTCALIVLFTNTQLTYQLPFFNNQWQSWQLTWAIHLDTLAAFFLVIISLITCCVVFYIPSYLRKHEQSLSSLLQLTFFSGLFIFGMYVVVLAQNVLTFIAAWELMSLTSYFLVTYQHHVAENRQAGFIYLIMAHLSGLFILLGFGVIAKFSHSLDFTIFHNTILPTNWSVAAFILAFIGFGIKAGLVPLHVWLPKAHPVAPSHISALMSGVMLKVAVYGFIRFTFSLLQQVSLTEGFIVLLCGSLSALMGVLYALTQHNLKRLLAYHSVENIGIIFIGIGLSMIFLSANQKLAALIGLVAALYHCLNHAIFKSLLFLGAGAISQRTHEHDLNRMGGLIHRMPYTAVTFLVGCLSIAALPPFNGFVSEWLTMQTALQVTSLSGGVVQILILSTVAILALTGALAAACFVKVFGIAFLGKPRSRNTRRANCTKIDMQIALGILATFCLFLGIFPGIVFTTLANIIAPLIKVTSQAHALNNWLWLIPTTSHKASYTALLIVLVIAATLILCYFIVNLIKPAKPTTTVPAWDCGFGALTSRTQYTATAFAMPIRRVFGNLWLINRELTTDPTNGKTFYKIIIIDRIWQNCYMPIGKLTAIIAKYLAKIQSGSIRAYLSYMFFVLLILLFFFA